MAKRPEDKAALTIPVPNGTAVEAEDAASVPNGTLVPTTTEVVGTETKLERLVEDYRRFAKQAADGILKLCQTVLQAESELTPLEFKSFCAAVGLERDGSTYRKLRKIGQEASRFEPVIDRMPANWTTAHKLAVLEKPAYDRVIQDERFKPTMTAADLSEIVAGRKPPNEEQLSRDITVDLSNLDHEQTRAMIVQIAELHREFAFRYEIGGQITKKLVPAKTGSKPTLDDLLQADGGR